MAPIRVDLSNGARTAAVTITNEKPERTRLQVDLREWSQDENGADRYTETEDLVFFPRILTFETAGEKLIRIGMKAPAGEREKTYRLYIEEIPDSRKKDEGANVVIALRFGLPIFVKPRQASPDLALQKLDFSRGAGHVLLVNSGSASSIIRRVVFSGKNTAGDTIFTGESGGWYLLAGASRDYSAFVPGDLCPQLAKLDVVVETGEGNLEGKLDVDKRPCSP